MLSMRYQKSLAGIVSCTLLGCQLVGKTSDNNQNHRSQPIPAISSTAEIGFCRGPRRVLFMAAIGALRCASRAEFHHCQLLLCCLKDMIYISRLNNFAVSKLLVRQDPHPMFQTLIY
jgi:hypothetical protein